MKENNKKVLYEISDYSDCVNVQKREEIEKKLKENNIYFFISNYEWFECGKVQERKRTKENLIEIYQNCFQLPCLSLFDGKIYNCTRAAAIARLTHFNFNQDEIVNIRDEKINHFRIRTFYTKSFYSFCSFCNPTQNRIKRGEQTKEKYIIKLLD